MSIEHSNYPLGPFDQEVNTAGLEDFDFFTAPLRFNTHDVPQPPVEPLAASRQRQLHVTTQAVQVPGRHVRPGWINPSDRRYQAHMDHPAFSRPLDELTPFDATPMYDAIVASHETFQTPEAAAAPEAEPHAAVIETSETTPTEPVIEPPRTYKVAPLAARGDIVPDGERGSIFEAMNHERTDRKAEDYTALRRPVVAPEPIFATIDTAPQLERSPERPAVEAPASVVASEQQAEAPEVTPEAVSKEVRDDDTLELRIVDEVRRTPSASDDLLERVLEGLRKSRQQDLAAELPPTPAVHEDASEILASTELPQQPVSEERLTLRGLRTAAAELIAQHKTATRIGAAAVAITAGVRFLGRLRRR